MKKLLLFVVMALFFISAQAIALFPYFVDVVGNYNDGTPNQLKELNIKCKYWQNPKFYRKLKEADKYLNEVMPFDKGKVTRTESKPNDTVTIVKYYSPMLSGQTSTIYLVDIQGKGFYIGYYESPRN